MTDRKNDCDQRCVTFAAHPSTILSFLFILTMFCQLPNLVLAKPKVFLELRSLKTVCISEQIMLAAIYPSYDRSKWRLLFA